MKPSIVIQSDYGRGSLAFAKMAGIIETVSANSDVVDTNQCFEKDNVRQMSAYLFTTIPFWPDGTIFVASCGSGDKVAAELDNGSVLLSENNGMATMYADNFGVKRVFRLNEEYQSEEFGLARAAGVLNQSSLETIGQQIPLDDLVLFAIPASIIGKGLAIGKIGMLLKTFGNITFTIRTAEFEQTGIKVNDPLRVTITHDGQTVYQKEMTYQPSFGYVSIGEPVIFNGSSGYMDIGLNQRSFINECLPELLAAEDINAYEVRIERLEVL